MRSAGEFMSTCINLKECAMRKQWIVAALAVALLGLGTLGCEKKNPADGTAAPPRGENGSIDTVNGKTMTSPVDQASGAAARKRPLPATQPSTKP
jgi:hypothetical protein